MLFVYILLLAFHTNAQNTNTTECALAINSIALDNYDKGVHPIYDHNYQCSDAPLLVTFANTPRDCSVHCDSTTGCNAFSFSSDCSNSVGSCNVTTRSCEDTKMSRCTLLPRIVQKTEHLPCNMSSFPTTPTPRGPPNQCTTTTSQRSYIPPGNMVGLPQH